MVIFTKVKDQFCWIFTVFKWESLALQHHKHDLNVLKYPLFHRYIKNSLNTCWQRVDGEINVRKKRTALSPTNCWHIKIHYTRTLLSPTIITGFIKSAAGGVNVISQIPTSQFSSVHSSTDCANFTVKAKSVLSY